MTRHPVGQPVPALTSPPNTPPSYNSPSSREREDVTSTNAQVPYSPAFTDALMKRVLSLPSAPSSTSRRGASSSSKSAKEDGIKVLPPTSAESPTRGVSTRLQDIDPTTLPDISPADLPLALDDPRRVYASGVPGLRLTHPGGWLEGGPGPCPLTLTQLAASAAAAHDPADADVPRPAPPSPPDFARAFVEQYGIASPAALRSHVNGAVAVQVDELKRCMRNREDAIKKNEKLEREIADLVAEREMERRVHERQMKVRREKMEERERERLKASDG